MGMLYLQEPTTSRRLGRLPLKNSRSEANRVGAEEKTPLTCFSAPPRLTSFHQTDPRAIAACLCDNATAFAAFRLYSPKVFHLDFHYRLLLIPFFCFGGFLLLRSSFFFSSFFLFLFSFSCFPHKENWSHFSRLNSLQALFR